MVKYRIVFVLLVFQLAVKSYGQVDVIAHKIDLYDTLRMNSLSLDLDFLFFFSQKQMDSYVEFKFVNAARFNYLFRHSDFEIDFRQLLDCTNTGDFDFNHYVMLSSSIYKYRPVSKKRTNVRSFYVEPLFIFQNNSGRGLQWRFQIGALLHPLNFARPKFKLNFGIGFVYDWSSWEVNNQKKIDAVSPKLREKILFVNSHSKLRKNLYMDHDEFRPMLLINMSYQATKSLHFSLITSFQQSLVSPFNEEIKAAYPELKKVYPYIFSRFSVSVKVYKGLALKSSFILDYENNNLSIYDSSWEYSILLGVTYEFSNQKPQKIKGKNIIVGGS